MPATCHQCSCSSLFWAPCPCCGLTGRDTLKGLRNPAGSTTAATGVSAPGAGSGSSAAAGGAAPSAQAVLKAALAAGTSSAMALPAQGGADADKPQGRAPVDVAPAQLPFGGPGRGAGGSQARARLLENLASNDDGGERPGDAPQEAMLPM